MIATQEFERLWDSTPGPILDDPRDKSKIEEQARMENTPWVRIQILICHPKAKNPQKKVPALVQVIQGKADAYYCPDGIGHDPKQWKNRSRVADNFFGKATATPFTPPASPNPTGAPTQNSTSTSTVTSGTANVSAPTEKDWVVPGATLFTGAIVVAFILVVAGLCGGWVLSTNFHEPLKPKSEGNQQIVVDRSDKNSNKADKVAEAIPPSPLPPTDGEEFNSPNSQSSAAKTVSELAAPGPIFESSAQKAKNARLVEFIQQINTNVDRTDWDRTLKEPIPPETSSTSSAAIAKH